MIRRPIFGALSISTLLLLTACGAPGPPLPPSLELPQPVTDLRAARKGDKVALTWTGILHEQETPELRHAYRVYRRQEGTTRDEIAGQISLTTSGQATVVDHGFEWQKSYDYHVTVVSVIPRPEPTAIEVEGNDSPPVHVVTSDVFPPAAPTGLQAVFSGVGQPPFIDLTWAPNTDADLAGYNAYRREQGGQAVKINTDLIKTPAFRDRNVESGRQYFYSVSAVDLRGNQSTRSEEASESVP